MADPDHLDIFYKGATIWNLWRAEHPDILPDLSHEAFHYQNISGFNLQKANLNHSEFEGSSLDDTNLHEADLVGADFTESHLADAVMTDAWAKGAIFYDAKLVRTNLQGADLTDANFSQAILHMADLSEVNLRWAMLESTDLEGATLSGAHLLGAVFAGANVRNTLFEHAHTGLTIFSNIDFREAKGLETIEHNGPSTIGLDSIYMSNGLIPEIFLRGCGTPDEFLTYMRSLVMQPIQFYSCFMSYSSKNKEFAERLYADLQNKGVRCWFAPEDLKIGDKIRDRIDSSIRLRDKLLLILSEHSIASDWVEHEVESALEEERQRGRTILFPIRLDEAVMDSSKAWAALIRRTRHIGDFREWKNHDSYQKAFDRLLRDLKAEDKTASS